MKKRTVYVCETCGYESENYDEMEAHEAAHLGLTVKELHDYNGLQSLAQEMGAVVYYTNNEETRAQFDKAIEDLIMFEKEHNLNS